MGLGRHKIDVRRSGARFQGSSTMVLRALGNSRDLSVTLERPQ